MNSKEIRSSFINFFERRDHKFIRSSPVVPLDDPTLLFTNAGMNQFKPIFLDQIIPDSLRAVNSQKCIRVSGKHNDLEEVGVDTFHHTFFEMLGNWSFGDYYKKEAIQWAWELFTSEWKFDQDRLWATVYEDDDGNLASNSKPKTQIKNSKRKNAEVGLQSEAEAMGSGIDDRLAMVESKNDLDKVIQELSKWRLSFSTTNNATQRIKNWTVLVNELKKQHA